MQPAPVRLLVRGPRDIQTALAADPTATVQTSADFAVAAGPPAMRQLQDLFPRLVVDASQSIGFALQCIRAGCRWLYLPEASPELTAFAKANGCELVSAAEQLATPPYLCRNREA